MSKEYDEYLENHRSCVLQAYDFLVDNGIFENDPTQRYYILKHDKSKYGEAEYDAYDRYFYEDNDHSTRMDETEDDFLYAFLHHIHNNPHHWQYWVLINDSEDGGEDDYLEIPQTYVIEMICDWWSFSWSRYNENHNTQELYSIFDWYRDNKNNIKMNVATRGYLEDMLNSIFSLLSNLDESL